MRFSALWLWGLRHEFERKLVGASVVGGRKERERLQFGLEKAGRNMALDLWLTHGWGRAELSELVLTDRIPSEWAILQGTTCVRVEQPEFDRRLVVVFNGEGHELKLDFCAFTRPLVVLRTESQEIATTASGPAKPSPQPKAPFVLSAQESCAAGLPTTMTLSDWFKKYVRGADSVVLEAALRATGSNAQDVVSSQAVDALLGFFRDRAAEFEHGEGQGYVVWRGQEPMGLNLFDLRAWLPELSFARHESLSLASEAFARAFEKRESAVESRETTLRRAGVMKRKIERRLNQLHVDLSEQLEHERWRQNADWLLSQLGQIERGATSIEVPGEVEVRTVQLDPAIRPEKQAEKWYAKARRLRRGVKQTEEQIERTRRDLDLLERALSDARTDATSDDTDAWRRLSQIVQQGAAALGKAAQIGEAPRKPRVSFRRFRSPGGLAIWVGRTDAENDELTFHQAHKRDLWFHTQQCPGSHVVLRSHALKSPPSKSDVLAAAATAAYFSKARNSSKVPVIYTEARYVRKPRKAPPGQVMVEREKSIMVKPQKLSEWGNGEDE